MRYANCVHKFALELEINTSNKFPKKVGNNVYPRPEYRYPDGKIGLTYKDSVADFSKPLQAPDGASNIMLVIPDDVGFSWLSAFFGLIEMPTVERLAKNGLFYNQFHTTTLCPPTRDALLTGRNHHSAHSGNIGALYGPVVMILLVTSIDVYSKYLLRSDLEILEKESRIDLIELGLKSDEKQAEQNIGQMALTAVKNISARLRKDPQILYHSAHNYQPLSYLLV